jgi:hypothetical protein
MPDDQRIPSTAPHCRIEIGDTIAYTRAFVDRHSRYPNALPAARGTVKALHRLQNGSILADIEWNKPHLPKRVNIKNLMKVNPPRIGE